MEESNIRVNKLKGQRKPRAKKEDPEPEPEAEVVEKSESEPEPEPETKPKKAPAKKSKAEEYDVTQEPDVIIHKRHKGVKPRKIIVITGDSSCDEEDEKMPYRKAPKVEVKKREPKIREPSPEPVKKAPPKKQNVGLIAGNPKTEYHDDGKGISQAHVKPAGPKNYIVDSFIDGLLGL
jgi:hypothetical protein